MDSLKQAQSVLNELTFPMEVDLKFEDYDIKNFQVQSYMVKSDPYFLSTDSKTKIFLRYPFYFQIGRKAGVVSSEEHFEEFDVLTSFTIKKIIVTDLQTLEIKCANATFLALPGVSFGWGIYKDNRQLVQHNGLEDGIDF